jgi:hypothetical protein
VSEPAARRARRGFEAVRKILWEDWDPIGCGVPPDEYDSYAWPVLEMLQRKAKREEIDAYLRWAADQAMMSPVAEKKRSQIVDALVALDI